MVADIARVGTQPRGEAETEADAAPASLWHSLGGSCRARELGAVPVAESTAAPTPMPSDTLRCSTVVKAEAPCSAMLAG